MEAIQQTQDAKQAIEVSRRPLPFIPENLDDVWRTADMLAKSGIIPDALKAKPYDVMVVLLAGRELGLETMQALRMVYVVKGRPFISAALKIAKVKQSQECVYLKCVETTADRAIFETERKGEPGTTRIAFTLAQAKAAGLYPGMEGSNWRKYPEVMLRWRAASQLCDLVFADVIGNIGTKEEHEDELVAERAAKVTAPPPPAQVNAPPAAKAQAKKEAPQDAEFSEPAKPSLEEARRAAGAVTSAMVADKAPPPVSDESEPPPPSDADAPSAPPGFEPVPEVEEKKPASNEPPSPEETAKKIADRMRMAAEAGDITALKAQTPWVKLLPTDLQAELRVVYNQCSNAIKAKAGSK